MNDEARFTQAQRKTVQSFKGWQLFRRYPNEDIIITVGDRFYRINKDGVLVDKWGGGEAPKPPPLPKRPPMPPPTSLSEQLTKGIKTPPIKKAEQLPLGPQIAATPIKAEPKTYPTKTICQEIPECCQPREIKAIFWDADHTIWDLEGTAASVTATLRKVDDDTVVELSSRPPPYRAAAPYVYELTSAEKALLEGLSPEERDFLISELEKEHGALRKPKAEKPEKREQGEHIRTTIKLDPTFRQTLDELEKMKIASSIISLNTPGSVKRIIREFGLEGRFTEIRDSYVNKGKVFRELTQKQHICPCDALFVDDSRTNTEAVSEKCGIALQIGRGKDIEQTIDVLKYIRGAT